MNIYESIAAIMQEAGAISKDKKNQKQGFMYRGIDDVMNTFNPLLAKHKVFVVPEVIEREREERQSSSGGNLIYSILTINYHFYAEDGSSITATVVGEGMDSGDKASNKAMAVGMKYAMFQTFCIPTEDMKNDDPDKETPPPSEPKKNGRGLYSAGGDVTEDAISSASKAAREFLYGNAKKPSNKEPVNEDEQKTIEDAKVSQDEIEELIAIINRKGSVLSKILSYYKVKSLKELTIAQAEHLRGQLEKKPDVKTDNPFLQDLDDIPR